MNGLSDKDIQRYHDGELSPSETRRVLRALEESPRDRLRLQALAEMGDLLRESVEERAAAADLSGIWAAVVTAGERRPETRLEPRPGTRRWLHGYRLLAAASAAAAAVAVLLFALPGGPGRPARNDAVIESIEVGPGAMSTIFTIDDPENTGETTVIWVSDVPSGGET